MKVLFFIAGIAVVSGVAFAVLRPRPAVRTQLDYDFAPMSYAYRCPAPPIPNDRTVFAGMWY